MKEIGNQSIVVIAGATATGKTAAAAAVAESMSGEIISADSMQIYKYMDIGTAKPTPDEMRGIPHYMIDELEPDEEFNAAVFKKMAEGYLRDIHSRGKLPIIAGGTGFYINALIKNTDFTEDALNPDIRQYYEGLVKQKGSDFVYSVLCEKDPASAKSIHPNNVKRVIRALEYFDSSGGSIAEHNTSEKAKIIDNNICFIVLHMDRTTLYERINARVDKMIDDGLKGEVESLLEMGFGKELVSMQGIGYKEMIQHINGECSFDETLSKIKQATRNYAKRQITWFKHQTSGIQLDATAIAQNPEILTELIKSEIRRRENAI